MTRFGSRRERGAARLLLTLVLAAPLAHCAALERSSSPGFDERHFRGEQTNAGPERYGSWFGDSDDHVFYFGLSPFNDLALRCRAEGGAMCPLADLAQAGDHLIGRFDLHEERFLAPLLVRRIDPEATSSVWDVLVHSNGRIYYTTFWNEFGSVRPDGSGVEHYAGAGSGLNELWEGPEGEIYVTRYLGDRPGVAVFGPDGVLRRELTMPQEAGALVCPKSLAVDPGTGEVWMNSDVFYDDGRPVGYDAFRLSPEGEVLERITRPLLQFMSFDAAGRGWFVDDEEGVWRLRIEAPGGPTRVVDLGPHHPIDVVQDIKHFRDVTVLMTWQRRVFAVRTSPDGRADLCVLPASPVPDCPALGYTAVVSERSGRVYQTIDCGIHVVRAGALDACAWHEAP